MISFTVRLRFDEAERAAVAELLRPVSEATRQEPGCVSYIAHFVEGEPATVLIYEQYVDAAAVEAHRGSPHFQKYVAEGLYKKMLSRQVEQLDAVG